MKHFSVAFLHVGTDKTGTSSIQEALHNSRTTLQQSATAAYPPAHTLLPLGGFFYEDPRHYVHFVEHGIEDINTARNKAHAAMSEVTAWLSRTDPCRALILSYEGYVTMEQPALERMHSFLLTYAETVKAIYYARPPVSYLASAISQSTKFGRNPYEALPVINHADNLRKLEYVFGKNNIIVRQYGDQTLVGGNAVTDFAYTCGIDPRYISFPPQKNESLTNKGLMVGTAIIDRLKTLKVHDAFFPAEFFKSFGSRLSSLKGDKILISPHHIDDVLLRSKASIAYLKDNYGIDLAEDPLASVAAPLGGSDSAFGDQEYIDDIVEWLVDEVLDFTDCRGRVTIAPPSSLYPPGQPISLRLSLVNESPTTWYSTKLNPIYLCYWWTDEAGMEIHNKRTRLSIDTSAVRASRQLEFTKELRAPSTPGTYALNMSAVRENRFWLHDYGLLPGRHIFTIQ